MDWTIHGPELWCGVVYFFCIVFLFGSYSSDKLATYAYLFDSCNIHHIYGRLSDNVFVIAEGFFFRLLPKILLT